MVDRQIRARGIHDTALLAAFAAVPRHVFVPPALQKHAYADAALPIGRHAGNQARSQAGSQADSQARSQSSIQTISQPYIVARMIDLAQVRATDNVLDVGTGSGYAAAILARLAARVVSIERDAGLAQHARETLARLNVRNVDCRTGDGTLGVPEAAPFDAILCAAGGPGVPRAWREQLAMGGRIVMPVETGRGMQRLVRLTRRDAVTFEEASFERVRFVPLIGAQGWDDAARPDG
ncbi:methyltransferase domain-containing protein [Paraburkholderia acidisoli]|uniref:Protein-L-isoaspartate O-methyltransferase n=2 Tax=Paraburkholderia acidisoli TaxID=2571748 RepID=A0A7Z2GS90_9BURK|nr:methyltransferase domain-containing protein [Paraburkholderia acidisoli]